MARADEQPGKTYDDYVADARERVAGREINLGALGFWSNEDFVAAELRQMYRDDPSYRRASQDRFFATYGVRRGDDPLSRAGL